MYAKNLLRQSLRFHHCSRSSIKGSRTADTGKSLNFEHTPRILTSFTKRPSYTSGQHIQTVSQGVINWFIKHQFTVRTAVTATMAQEQNSLSSAAIQGNEVTVIRYQPEDERFQMQVTLHNGKVFNFDRKATDSVASVVARMVVNISKKVKTFEGNVQFLVENGSEEETTEMEKLLTAALSINSGFKLQVDDHIYEIVINPPEFHQAKFFSLNMPTYPLFPYKMETSSNFDKRASLYKWEFSNDKPSLEVTQKLKKKSKESGAMTAGSENMSWVECGTEFIFTPDLGMVGGYLKFSCTPSDGKTFGKSFSMVLPNPIVPLPVDTFLYQERLSRLCAKREEGGCFRVLTYNVLADTYATPEWFIASPKESLDVGYRLPILNKELKLYGADLICLQEVDDKYFEGNFEPFLASEGFKGRHTSKAGNTMEGVATFHNPTKLTELEFHHFVIFDEMKKLPLWERLKTVGDDFIQRLEDRNTVFHISVFRVNDCPKETILVASNVHLYFHPDADHIRLLQTVTCIDRLEKTIARVKNEHPESKVTVIYCGDLNCTPPFSSYRLLTTGVVHENDEDWTSHSEEKISPGISMKHSLNLKSSHPGEELTNITTCFEGCIDYILYQAENLDLLSTCPPPNKEIIAALTKVDTPRQVSLPNFYTPSDHLPLIADFKVKS